MGRVGAPLGPWGVLRGRPGARGSRSLPIGGGGGEVGVGGEVGGGGEVQKRCTSQGGAKPAARERPNAFFLKARPRGDPAVHPTPTAKARLATPTVRLPRCLVQLRRCLTGAFERCIELPEKRWSPTQRPGGDPAVDPTPNTQRPQPTQRPRTNPYGSRRQRQACFRTTLGGTSQSISPADLVVVAL